VSTADTPHRARPANAHLIRINELFEQRAVLVGALHNLRACACSGAGAARRLRLHTLILSCVLASSQPRMIFHAIASAHGAFNTTTQPSRSG
jgi:hypothetical protein